MSTQIRLWSRALRVHQWAKNLLVFVPLFTSFTFLEIENVFTASCAFIAFSLAASATYLVNDVLDLESDRAHTSKYLRPLASGEISVRLALITAAGLFAAGLVLAYFISMAFCWMIIIYMVVSACYSAFLKRIFLVDVIILSFLYTIRVHSGSVAIDVTTSNWLIEFSVFLFLSLALMKRCMELVSATEAEVSNLIGRGYRVADLVILWPLGIGAGLTAVLVLGLFLNDPETTSRYASPELLWGIVASLTYWLFRLWFVTARGEMHDDPIVFAIKDRISWVVGILLIVIVLLAHFLEIG